MIGTYTCWFEVTGLSAGDGWVRFDRTPEYGEGASCGGEFVDYECYRDPLRFAVEELDKALPEIVSAEPVQVSDDGVERRLRWAGVRVRVWPDEIDRAAEDVAGEPVALVQATGEQMASARVAAAAEGVLWAQRDLDDARTRLRAEIVEAATDGVGRNQIARVTERALARRLVLQHLAAHDVRLQAERALPREVANSVVLTVAPGDDVTLHITGTAFGSENDRRLDHAEEPRTADIVQARGRALATADAVLVSLRRELLVVRTSDGQDATPEHLVGPSPAESPTVVITRHPHAPRGFWEGPSQRSA